MSYMTKGTKDMGFAISEFKDRGVVDAVLERPEGMPVNINPTP